MDNDLALSFNSAFSLRRYMSALHRYPESLTREQKVERFLTDLARKLLFHSLFLSSSHS